MLIEKEKPHSRRIPLLIKHQREGEAIYEPILVNETAHNDIAHFIIEETSRLNKKLISLRTMPPKRSKREIRDIRKSRKEIIRKEQIVETLLVLKGRRSQPIRLISEGDRITKLELVSFDQKGQKEYWEYIKNEDQVSKVAKLAKVYPEGFEILSELFNIRYTIKHGSLKGITQAEKDHKFLIKRVGEIPDDREDILILLVPLTKMITEKFGN